MKQTERSTAAVLHGGDIQKAGRADVWKVREKTRKRRLWRLIIFLGLFDGYLWYRYATDNPFELPALGPDWVIWAPIIVLGLLIVLMMGMPLMSGRSPHVVVRPEEIEVGLSEIKGLMGFGGCQWAEPGPPCRTHRACVARQTQTDLHTWRGDG